MCSYLRHGLAGAAPKAGGWRWEELQELNAGVDWQHWERELLPAVLAAEGVDVPAACNAGGSPPSVAASGSGLPDASLPVHPSLMHD